ncbi:hypothetical protein AURDEDRAFT_143198 [Auricularia subglabra TFB-10046 SS5]|nr:hypothetical protein AURDEDRAFT_143198 [Auricularia subglabra TFB-10046 SS5]
MRNIARRTLATIVEGTHKPGALRPHLGFETAPKHPLWAFFRRNAKDEPVIIDPNHPDFTLHGRAWTAEELRRKSFRDLHTLWYAVARERNLLASQRDEARRMGINKDIYLPPLLRKNGMCRDTQARIKLVLSERRHAHSAVLELEQQEAGSAPTPASTKPSPSSSPKLN